MSNILHYKLPSRQIASNRPILQFNFGRNICGKLLFIFRLFKKKKMLINKRFLDS